MVHRLIIGSSTTLQIPSNTTSTVTEDIFDVGETLMQVQDSVE